MAVDIYSPAIDPAAAPPARARPGWDAYFLGIAFAVAARADCRRRQVGAVLVGPDHRVLEVGYNGAPSGHPGCLEGACPRGLLTYEQVAASSSYDSRAGRCEPCGSERAVDRRARRTRGHHLHHRRALPELPAHDHGRRGVRAVWPGFELDTSVPDGQPVADAGLQPAAPIQP